ncbi:Uncharacterized protein BM_BM10418 [Brugia malayi]|uniref:Bm10418 n=1 Tax=Brugia malayi TaxID=6279 RepID=A0A0K0IN64_BRUMA|nr:Uncharacterized protein BM_BM10418 [Brugia malayi]CDP98049.1 Bm10418 [Brugia malayi]VIO93820.1 Uncharacterized protein BM_BM10418 [Brugia malayi]
MAQIESSKKTQKAISPSSISSGNNGNSSSEKGGINIGDRIPMTLQARIEEKFCNK